MLYTLSLLTALCCTVPEDLQALSVSVIASGSQGSGSLLRIGGRSYVLTAGHVVESLRHVEDKKVTWADASIYRCIVEDGRAVGEERYYARVVRYSPYDKEDLALLEVRKKDYSTQNTVFDGAIQPVGTKLIHVGSLLGIVGSNSVTTGTLAQVGRLINGVVFDQTSCPAFPGSSGGGVFSEDGKYVGMLVRGSGETFNLIVPSRRILDWMKRVGISDTEVAQGDIEE